MNGRVIQDSLPGWQSIMSQSEHITPTKLNFSNPDPGTNQVSYSAANAKNDVIGEVASET